MSAAICGETRISKAAGLVETRIDGEVVLMHLDSGKFYSLADTGRRAWILLDECVSVSALAASMSAEYDVAPEQCERELIELVTALVEQDIVSVRDGPA